MFAICRKYRPAIRPWQARWLQISQWESRWSNLNDSDRMWTKSSERMKVIDVFWYNSRGIHAEWIYVNRTHFVNFEYIFNKLQYPSENPGEFRWSELNLSERVRLSTIKWKIFILIQWRLNWVACELNGNETMVLSPLDHTDNNWMRVNSIDNEQS